MSATLGHGTIGRQALIASHFHVAALGFGAMVVVGIGSRMLPMFLVSHGFPRWPLRSIAPLTGAGLGALVAGQFTGAPGLGQGGGLLLGLAGLCYLRFGADYFRRRLRRVLGLRFGAWPITRGEGTGSGA